MFASRISSFIISSQTQTLLNDNPCTKFLKTAGSQTVNGIPMTYHFVTIQMDKERICDSRSIATQRRFARVLHRRSRFNSPAHNLPNITSKRLGPAYFTPPPFSDLSDGGKLPMTRECEGNNATEFRNAGVVGRTACHVPQPKADPGIAGRNPSKTHSWNAVRPPPAAGGLREKRGLLL